MIERCLFETLYQHRARIGQEVIRSASEFNYLLLSDFHVVIGVDPRHKITNPREDFFYDEEFFRFLKWADKNPEGGEKWELIFVGDCSDFLPIDLG